MNECIQRAVRRALTASHIRIQPAARRVVVAAATADDVRATNGQQTRLTRPDPGDFIDLAACDHGVGLIQFSSTARGIHWVWEQRNSQART